MVKIYTGIGSRETPNSILVLMTRIALFLGSRGYILRSGGAPGADSAFENGATLKQIFLPWKNFNNNSSPFHEPTEEAINVSRMLFPHFPGVSRGSRLLISRNMHQILGPEIHKSPRSDFVICWTKDGKKIGGTAYAIKAAEHFDIPVYNLGDDNDMIKLWWKLKDIDQEHSCTRY